MPIFLKSGYLNLLEPYGPVQACNGIALPYLYLTLNELVVLDCYQLYSSNLSGICPYLIAVICLKRVLKTHTPLLEAIHPTNKNISDKILVAKMPMPALVW
jgi:hypothetical protein